MVVLEELDGFKTVKEITQEEFFSLSLWMSFLIIHFSDYVI